MGIPRGVVRTAVTAGTWTVVIGLRGAACSAGTRRPEPPRTTSALRPRVGRSSAAPPPDNALPRRASGAAAPPAAAAEGAAAPLALRGRALSGGGAADDRPTRGRSADVVRGGSGLRVPAEHAAPRSPMTTVHVPAVTAV